MASPAWALSSLGTGGLWIARLRRARPAGVIKISPQDKAFPERILRIKIELAATADRSGAADFRNDCVVRSKPGDLDSLNRHQAADNTLNRNLLVEP